METKGDYESRMLRTAFSTPAGIEALGSILIDAGLFDTDLEPHEVYAENNAKKILAKMGIFELKNIDNIVKALLGAPHG